MSLKLLVGLDSGLLLGLDGGLLLGLDSGQLVLLDSILDNILDGMFLRLGLRNGFLLRILLSLDGRLLDLCGRFFLAEQGLGKGVIVRDSLLVLVDVRLLRVGSRNLAGLFDSSLLDGGHSSR